MIGLAYYPMFSVAPTHGLVETVKCIFQSKGDRQTRPQVLNDRAREFTLEGWAKRVYRGFGRRILTRLSPKLLRSWVAPYRKFEMTNQAVRTEDRGNRNLLEFHGANSLPPQLLKFAWFSFGIRGSFFFLGFG